MAIAPPPGIYVPALLFFDENEDFDIPSIKAHVLRLAQGGVTGILVQGSNGEAQHLTHVERTEAIRITREVLDQNGFSDVIIIAGTGAQSTKETILLCKEAKDAGAAYCLVLTPSLFPAAMTEEAIIRFHRTVADASPIPIMVYNFPVVTAGLNLQSEVIAALATHPNIVGTKLSCGDIGKLHRLTTKFPSSSFAVYAGRSDVLLPGMHMGSAGGITALCNLVPKVHAHMIKLFNAGHIAESTKIQTLMSHADAATTRAGGIGGLKSLVAKHFGYGTGRPRGPLSVPTTKTLEIAEQGEVNDIIALEKTL